MKNTVCTLCLRGLGFHAKPIFFSNIFSGDLYFKVLIIELFCIRLVISQREKMNTNLAEVCLMELGVRGNYVRCLVIVVISMGLEEQRRLGEVLDHHFERSKVSREAS